MGKSTFWFCIGSHGVAKAYFYNVQCSQKKDNVFFLEQAAGTDHIQSLDKASPPPLPRALEARDRCGIRPRLGTESRRLTT